MPKIIFANQLRGLAAMFVAGSHLVGAFWAMRDFVGLATATPVQDGTPPAILGLFTYPWLNFGPFGVGVFFLISGLVIPISLEQHTRGSFMLARLLRIYPTYIAALVIEMAVLHADAAFWGKPFPYGNWTIICNGLLIYSSVGQPSIDLVNWTLCVELKFYLLMALLAPQIWRGSLSVIMLAAAAILTTNTAITWYPFATGGLPAGVVESARMLTVDTTFIVFMLLGVLFNFHLRGMLRHRAFIAGCAGLLALFLASWTQSAISQQIPVVTVNYLYALVLFSIMYSLRRFARPFLIIDFIASISFPFYLIHSLLGYAILKFLILALGLSYAPAVCIALPILVSVAAALHFTIEIKSIAIGRLLARVPKDPSSQPVLARRISAVCAPAPQREVT